MLYEPLIYNAKGLNLDNQVIGLTSSVFTKLDNWSMGQDNMSSNRLGILTKLNNPSSTFISTLPVSGRCRGLYEYFPQSSQDARSYIFANIVTSEYRTAKIYFHQFVTGVSTWKVLTDSAGTEEETASQHFIFANRFDSWRVVDTLFFCNGGGFYKYFNDNIEDISSESQVVSAMSDVGGTAIDATTAAGDVTWTNGSDTVTIAADTFVAGVKKGTWIRESSTAQWYEVKKRVSTTELQLRSQFQETTATSATAEYAPAMESNPKYVIHWRDMNVAANFSTGFTGTPARLSWRDGASSGDLVTTDGDNLVIAEERTKAAGLVKFTDFLTEFTPAALETWSGTNSGGEITTLMHGITYITAITGLGDYFFLFGENEYVVYRFNADLIPPVSEVARKRKGCNSMGTIQAIDDYIIYFTGTEVRKTNGFSDILISQPISNDLKNKCFVQTNVKYITDTATDNNYPSSFYDSFNNRYHLYLTAKDDVSVRYDYCYDIDKKEWISGRLNSSNIAKQIESVATYSATETMSDMRAYSFPVIASDVMYANFLQTGRSALLSQGEIQSGDIFLNSIANKGKLVQVELWLHVGANTSATFDFTYYMDNVEMFSTPLEFTVTNATTDTDYIEKVNIPISGEGFNFRWNLKDKAWTGTGAISIVGGYLGIEPLKKEK